MCREFFLTKLRFTIMHEFCTAPKHDVCEDKTDIQKTKAFASVIGKGTFLLISGVGNGDTLFSLCSMWYCFDSGVISSARLSPCFRFQNKVFLHPWLSPLSRLRVRNWKHTRQQHIVPPIMDSPHAVIMATSKIFVDIEFLLIVCTGLISAGFCDGVTPIR